MNKGSTPGLIESLFLRSLLVLTLAQIVLCVSCSVVVARMPRRIAGQI
ncbi:MAG TPA: hypothetical protein VNY05_33045 [Candidatus Acidoferrales bacterium]|jgi:hypothetical protein|nr:hypothetical protein [Candidatus Acidoferrales bacterium]